MARPKKDSHPITIRMEQGLYDRLEKYCKQSGQPKTVALERALSDYIDSYDRKEAELAKMAKRTRLQ